MPNGKNVNVLAANAIDDHIRPNGRQFARNSPQTRPAALGKIFEPVAGRNEFHRHARGRSGIVLCDVIPDMRKVAQSAPREIHGHLGGGNSLSLPQDKSQRRTFS